jgi:hypothetical protein
MTTLQEFRFCTRICRNVRLAGVWQLAAAVAVAVGMWKPATFAGFQAPRAGRTVVAEAPSSRPRSVISTARPPFIGHSVENVLFGWPTERK